MYIYKITNKVNNKVYIGITVDVKKRFTSHLNSRLNYPLYKAFNKYGKDNFKFEIIKECETRDEACFLEKKYIAEYKSNIKKYGYNQTSGGENNCGSSNPRATLTDKDVLNIRKIRFSGKYDCHTIYKRYKDKISFSAFSKIWDGRTWKHIGKEFLDKKPSLEFLKSGKGEKNHFSLSTDKEIMKIRLYYVNHTLHETYLKYGSKYKSENSFRQIIANSYKHLPIYSKTKKAWFFNSKIIDINDFTNPVSTISVSGE